jgi:hypothetical protein
MTPGAYRSISFEDYLADNMTPEPSLSRSTIIDLLDCPARAFANNSRLNPPTEEDEEPDEAKFDVGTAAHSLLLEGIDKAFVVDPAYHPGAKGAIPKGWTTNEMKEIRDSIRSAGKIPLLPKQYKKVVAMVDAATKAIIGCSELGITDLQSDGDSELSYIWEEDGIWLRTRPDWISKDRKTILDFKTTGKKANPAYLGKHISDMGYEVQEALYRRGVQAIDKKDPAFIFVFQEDEPPYLCSFVDLDMFFKEMGEQKVTRGIKLWRECLSTGIWSGYPNNVYTVEPPVWAQTKWEDIKYGGSHQEDLSD